MGTLAKKQSSKNTHGLCRLNQINLDSGPTKYKLNKKRVELYIILGMNLNIAIGHFDRLYKEEKLYCLAEMSEGRNRI